ncbi:MAG TPA: histidine kinase [Bryobacteraceae bacterium]|jgi:two-component system sensor histidine kinase AlgZ|nr:histidine kinase [Bryobacteraceae bacterium]
MHPIFAKKKRVEAYLVVWVLIGGLMTSFLRMPGILSVRESAGLAIPLCALYAFFCLTPWYMCPHLPLRTTNPISLIVQHLVAALLASGICVKLANFIARQGMHANSRFQIEVPYLIAVGLLLYAVSVALHYMYLAQQESRDAELLARDAELRALKAQINPHFLFNSLNSITALTTVDPAKAREMCIRLSDFLRNTLGLGERETISWREELALSRTYLDVEQVRFGSRLRVEIDVDEACSDCLVPPLVLQPLIENAVKHGIATMVEGGLIRVEGHVVNGSMEVSVENDFDPDSPSPRRHGLGLRNVRSRLTTRFGDKARLTAHVENNQFRAEMVVPYNRADK